MNSSLNAISRSVFSRMPARGLLITLAVMLMLILAAGSVGAYAVDQAPNGVEAARPAQDQQICPQCPTTLLQVAIVIDGSGSISGSDFTLEKQGVAAAIDNIPADSSVEVTVIQFGSGVYVEVAPTVIDSVATRDAVSDAVLAIGKDGGSTNMDGGINTAVNRITTSPLFECTPYQVINLSTDGYPNDDSAAKAARDAAIAAGIDEFDIEAIGGGVNISYLNTLAYPQPPSTAPNPGFVQSFSNFEQYAAAISGKVNRLLQNVPADLGIAKWADFDVISGEELFYHFRIWNNGPGDAYNIVVRDTLPADVVYLADDADACAVVGSGPNGEQIVECTLDKLECGVSWEFIIKTRVEADAVANAGGVFSAENVAEVSATNSDPNPANNVAEASTFVQEEADLQITKISEPHDTVRAGQTFTYTIFVDNLGPSVARNVTITDTLLSSSNVTIQSCAFSVSQGGGAITQFTCTTGQLVSTQFGTDIGTFRTNRLDPLSPGSQGRLRASFRLVANIDIDVMNTTRVSAATPDPNMDNNFTTDPIHVTAVADLAVTKTAAVASVNAGEKASWTVTVTNNGPSPAENVVVKDFLPDGIVDGSVVVVGPTCTYGEPGNPLDPIVCNLGTLAKDQTVNFAVTADVDPAFIANQPQTPSSNFIDNDVWVASDIFDPDTSDNLDSDYIQVTESADLGLQKFAVGTPRAGGVMHYEIQISNLGPSVSRDVTLRDFLPQQVVFLNAFVDVEGGTGGVPLPCTITAGSNVLFCPLGNIAKTGTAPILVFVDVFIRSDVPDSTVITNTADVNLKDTPDPNSENNSASAGVTVLTTADLAIEKTSEPQKQFAGEQIKYNITVTNLGPSDAQNVTVTDYLPAGVTYEIDTDHCVEGPPGTLVCTDGTLKPGETWEFVVWVRVNPNTLPDTVLVNRACVLGQTTLGDPVAANNCATAQNLVLGKADLKITKFGKPDGQVRAGDNLTYTVIIDNLGPGFAHDVVLTDVLQSDLTFELVSVVSDRPATCTPTAGTFTERLQVRCKLTDPLEVMTPASSGRWILTMVVTADETQDINNVAHVVSADFDPNTSNNQAFVMHEITDVADLALSKTATGEVQVVGQAGLVFNTTTPGTAFPQAPNYTTSPTQVTAGRRILYTLRVINNGPSTAENVVLSDRLPAGVEIYQGSLTAPAGVNCETGTPGEPLDRLTCGLGTLRVGEFKEVSFQVVVDPSVAAGKMLENDAHTYSDIFDPNNGNNFANTQTVVNTWADMNIAKSAVGDNVVGCDTELHRFIYRDLPNEVTAGRELRYTIQVQNNGSSDAQNVQVLDVLPDLFTGSQHYAVTFLRAVGASCRPDDEHELWTVLWPNASATGQAIVCNLGTVASGERATFDVYVQVDPSVPEGTVIDNGALVLFGPSSPPAQPPVLFPGTPNIPPTLPVTNDPFTENNFTVNNTTVHAAADVWITKEDVPAEARLDQPFEPDEAIAGNEHRYLITFGNDGPSVARDVAIRDLLDFKQAGILGETFIRCEPVDPDDLVTCAFVGPNWVNVTQLQVGNETILPGDLNPGDEFSFYLITKVDPGYVLDADDLIAKDTAHISTTTTDCRTGNNQDTEQTKIIAEADLKVTKTDTPDPGQNLSFDPVTEKFVYTYTLTVENLGPSDAAKVVLTDVLPPDATFVKFGTLTNAQCYFRDDGTVFCLIGNDPNNEGTLQRGRLNAGSSATIEIVVEVDPSATLFLENCVQVAAIAEADFPFRPGDPIDNPIEPANFIDGRTPTLDPNLANNQFCETTALVEPAVGVDKKAYVLRSPARGIDNSALDPKVACATIAADDILVLPGDEIMYCYTITNEGNTWLSKITLSDVSAGIVRTATSDFSVAYPSKPPLRGTVTIAGAGEAQTITIETPELEKAVLAPKGVADDYDHLLIVRSFTVDFPPANQCLFIVKGTNTATVVAVPSTKYSTPLPGAPPVSDTDTLHDTLALAVLEDTTKAFKLYDDVDMDGLIGPGDTVKYKVEIPNTGGIAATGVVFTDPLYNYIADNANDARVPGLLVNGSVAAALHVKGKDTVSGEVFDFDVEPPALGFGQTLLLRTQAPGVDILIDSAKVLPNEIVFGNNAGDDQVQVATRIAIPPQGYLLRVGDRVLPRPVWVTFALNVTYLVQIKETVPVDTIVLNHGWVDYNEIDVFDQRCPVFNGNPADQQQFENNQAINNHAGTPGMAYQNPEQPGWPEIPAGVEPTNFLGPKFPTYPREDDDPTWFKVERDAASIGADTRIQLPVLNFIGRSNDGVESIIEVQNVGRDVTRVALYLWSSYSGFCDPQAPGPFKMECSGRLPPGSTWTWRTAELPAGAYSGILVSYDRDLYECTDMAARIKSTTGKPAAWLPSEYFGGQPLAVNVVRTGPGSNDPGVNMSGAYEGFSRAMEGVRDPASDGYQYYVPNVYSQSEGFSSWLYVQNSGDECTSVELWLREHDQCLSPSICRISKLSPGETRALDVAAECGLANGFEGSATLRASQPLGIVADNVGRDVMLTSRGVPADIDYGVDYNGPDPYFSIGSYINYGPLIYREYQGWDTKIWVQNLSSVYAAKVKVYFLDASGDIINVIMDWVCPRGSQAFYLPVISGLPGNYVGSVRVESQEWWSPGDPTVDSPRIVSVAELRKYEGPARTEVLEGIAYNLFGEDEAYDWQTGEVESWGVRRIAIPSLNNRASGTTTEVAIQNVVPSPGFTDFAMYFYDQNGLIDYVCEKLNEKQVEYIPINTWGFIAPNFEGSAVISATYWTHAGTNLTGKSVGLAAVAVERVGTVLSQDIPGDESSGVQGIPIHKPFRFLREFEPPSCPGQPTEF